MEELAAEFRAQGTQADKVDEAAAELLGVNRTDLRCLDLLDQHGPMGAGELAKAAGLTTGAVTGLVDRLEALGYARRVSDPSDRRRVVIEMTPKARKAAMKIYGPLAELFQEMASDFTVEELAKMRDFLRRARELSAGHVDEIKARAASGRRRGSSRA